MDRLALLALFCLCFFSSACDFLPREAPARLIATDEWLEDLVFVVQTITDRHPSSFYRTPQEELRQAVAAAPEEIRQATCEVPR